MKRNIRNDSANQVDTISYYREQVDGISDSEQRVDAKSEAKEYKEYFLSFFSKL